MTSPGTLQRNMLYELVIGNLNFDSDILGKLEADD